jgi:predicted nucleic acid-binding protein
MAQLVIADAGPLIAFDLIDQLDVLQALFSTLTIVESVRSECAATPGPDVERIDAAITAGWMV